jgi:hypothetical protein
VGKRGVVVLMLLKLLQQWRNGSYLNFLLRVKEGDLIYAEDVEDSYELKMLNKLTIDGNIHKAISSSYPGKHFYMPTTKGYGILKKLSTAREKVDKG